MWTPRWRVAGALSCLSISLATLVATTPASAEPPMMKEQSVRPRIEARSKDDRYSVAIGGFLQARSTLMMRDADLSSWSIDTPRTRLYTFGHVFSRDVRYRLMVGTAPSSIEVEMYDAYIDWRATDALRLRVGRFKIPVFREWVESARMLASVERTILTQELLPGRDWGILASGELFSSHMEYAVGVFHGAGRMNALGGENRPLVAGRAAWNLMGRSIEGEVDFANSPRTLVVGASGFATIEPAETRRASAGFEVAYRGRGLDVTLELMGQKRQTASRTETLAGFYARADQYVHSLRSGFGARATRLVGQGAPDLSRTELSIDAAYYPAEHDLKVSADVGVAHGARGIEPFAMVQVQASF